MARTEEAARSSRSSRLAESPRQITWDMPPGTSPARSAVTLESQRLTAGEAKRQRGSDRPDQGVSKKMRPPGATAPCNSASNLPGMPNKPSTPSQPYLTLPLCAAVQTEAGTSDKEGMGHSSPTTSTEVAETFSQKNTSKIGNIRAEVTPSAAFASPAVLDRGWAKASPHLLKALESVRRSGPWATLFGLAAVLATVGLRRLFPATATPPLYALIVTGGSVGVALDRLGYLPINRRFRRLSSSLELYSKLEKDGLITSAQRERETEALLAKHRA
jgi:hypothetical protein